VLKFITHRPLWLNILVGIVLAFLSLAIFILSLNWLTHHNASRTVPSVTGKTYAEAKEILEKAGFEVEIQDSIYNDTARALAVIKQFPEPDEVVKVNRQVFLTINRAVPPMVEMPNLVGYSFRNAEMTLKNNNLKFGDTTFKADFARNAVLEQMYNGAVIAPGTKIRMGTKIDFVLGDGVGDKEFAVPVIVGMSFGDAKRLLESYSISIGSVVLDNVSDTAGAYIYRQNPSRFNDEKKLQHIRSGQTMDVWLQKDRPVKDSTAVPLTEEN
jgi:beta-lactam-binding protein with PASTA domain